MAKFTDYDELTALVANTIFVLYDLNEGAVADQTKYISGETLLNKVMPLATPTELTISSGTITLTQAVHKIQPESSTSDNIDTITATQGFYVLYASDFGTDTLTLRHGTGNISCLNAQDVVFSTGAIPIYHNGTTAFVMSRSKNGLKDGQGADLTIASGVITPTHKYHRVDTESAAATDDLDTILTTNAVNGDLLTLVSVNAARDTTLKDSTAIRLPSDFTLDATQDTATLMCVSTDTWTGIATSNNA